MQQIETLVKEINAIFETIQNDYSGFQKEIGLNCLSECGACCKNPNVGATILEMLPLAYWLKSQGTALDTREMLNKEKGQSCFFYKPTSPDGEKGHCTVYAVRPVLCRVFAAYPHHGKKDIQLSVCKKIKDFDQSTYEERLLDFRKKIKKDFIFPDQWQMKLKGLRPNWSEIEYPINIAALYALDIVLLYDQYKNNPSNLD